MRYSSTQAREDYCSGGLEMSYWIERNEDGWFVVITGGTVAPEQVLTDYDGRVKRFRTVDNAVKTLEKIGFDIRTLY